MCSVMMLRLLGATSAGGDFGDGSLFSLDLVDGSYLYDIRASFNGTDGLSPASGPSIATGDNVGTTEFGGAHSFGAVYGLDKLETFTAPLYSFCSATSCTDGANPVGRMVQINAGDYSGTTSGGGAHGEGTIFKIVPSTGVYSVVHSFAWLRRGAAVWGASYSCFEPQRDHIRHHV
jgi:uncharacterized repeat protein (TIGR03803 family)